MNILRALLMLLVHLCVIPIVTVCVTFAVLWQLIEWMMHDVIKEL